MNKPDTAAKRIAEIRIEANLSLLSSLDVAIQQAGGVILPWRELSQMDVAKLFSIIATNDIRFKYHGPLMLRKEDDPK